MHKLLCIVGPTGTGKTKLAIEESQIRPSILVSADSRQVYRGMDIVTGKDHPKGTNLYGVDIVDPHEPCSVSVWYDAIMSHINQAWDEGKQVIVVGGTGLYVKALTDGIATIHIPINQPLRNELQTLSIAQLQNRLVKLDNNKLISMNHSDSQNPRRLIRAIEVALAPNLPSTIKPLSSTQIIGLHYYHNSNHSSKVRERVLLRLKQGAIQETKSLIKKYGKNLQSLSAIGYKSIIKYLENKLTQDQLIEQWVSDELAYAKRQMTWFRKQSVIWYDIDTYGNTKN